MVDGTERCRISDPVDCGAIAVDLDLHPEVAQHALGGAVVSAAGERADLAGTVTERGEDQGAVRDRFVGRSDDLAREPSLPIDEQLSHHLSAWLNLPPYSFFS